MSIELAKAVANKVSDENSVVLWGIIKGFNPKKHSMNDLMALCNIMLGELE